MTSRSVERGRKIDGRLQREVLALLCSDKADLFLIELMFALTLAARGEYVVAGTMPPGSGEKLRPFNELMHRISSVLLHRRSAPDGAYPNEDVVLDLLEAGEAETGIRWALDRSIERVKRVGL